MKCTAVCRLLIITLLSMSLSGITPSASFQRASSASLTLAEASPIIPPLPIQDPILEPVLDLLDLSRKMLYGPDQSSKDGPLQKLTFDLILLSNEYQAFLNDLNEGDDVTTFETAATSLTVIEQEAVLYITIDAIANGAVETLLSELEDLDLLYGAAYDPVVSGLFPIGELEAMAELSSLRFAHASIVENQSGVVDSQGDAAMGTDQVREKLNLDGSGIGVGILSDTFNCLDGMDAEQNADELPQDINIMVEGNCQLGKDEGRAMGQIVHDIAPGSTQAFYTAFHGQAAFANGILALAEKGKSDVIVDDVLYLNEPMFQDGIIAQSVDKVYSEGTVYLSSAGNYGRQSYESPFRSVASSINFLAIQNIIGTGVLHDFDPGPGMDFFQQITIPPGGKATIILNWDEPYASATGGDGAASDLDILLLDSSMLPVALSIDNNLGNDPIEILSFTNNSSAATFNLAIVQLLGSAPDMMKHVYTGSSVTVDEYGTESGTIFGHANANGALTVGASFYHYSPAFSAIHPQPQPYSGRGQTPILFDENDNPIFETRTKPDILAPDGVNTTFFGTDLSIDIDDAPNFSGTSAAVPHGAGAAALLLESESSLNPAQIYGLMTQTAVDVVLGDDNATIGYDDDSGFGLLNAFSLIKSTLEHDVNVSVSATEGDLLPGEPVEFIYRFTNTGPRHAKNVAFNITYPGELIDVKAAKSFSNGINDTTSKKGNQINVDISVLDIEQFGTVVVQGTIDPTLDSDNRPQGMLSAISNSDIEVDNNQADARIVIRVPRIEFTSSQFQRGKRPLEVQLDQANPYADVQVDLVEYQDAENKAGIWHRQSVVINAGERSATVKWPDLASSQQAGKAERTIFLESSIGAAIGPQSVALIILDDANKFPTPQPTVNAPVERDNSYTDTPQFDSKDNSVPDNQDFEVTQDRGSLVPYVLLPVIK